MTTQTTIKLNDGSVIPQVGLGVWRTPDDQAVKAVEAAIKAGYRHIDTAAIYENEEGVGEGLRRGGAARKELFVTTKLWNDDQGFDQTLRACEASLQRLGLAYVDLYLIHWPSPKRGLYRDSWKALLRLKEEGLVRAVGVSNFTAEHLQHLIDDTGVKPVLNQIELHPRFQQRALRAKMGEMGVAVECWSPLGQGQLLEDPVIASIAARHERTPAQVIIRWHIQNDFIVIPKSVHPERIVQNFDVFGFELDAHDMAALAALDRADGRIGADPMTATF